MCKILYNRKDRRWGHKMLKEFTDLEKNIISNYIKSQRVKVVEDFDFEKKKITYSYNIAFSFTILV